LYAYVANDPANATDRLGLISSLNALAGASAADIAFILGTGVAEGAAVGAAAGAVGEAARQAGAAAGGACKPWDSSKVAKAGLEGLGVGALTGLALAIPFAYVARAVGVAFVAAKEALSGVSSTARAFSSTDPLVASLANKIESLYPGHVVGVNVPLRDAAGNLLTDADILLKNAVIQVKSGGSAQGLLRQLQRSEAATGLPSVGFAPNLPANSLRALSQQGGLVTGNQTLLLQVVQP